MRPVIIAVALALSASTAYADQFIKKASPHDVAQTMDRLEQALKEAGAAVVARINHTDIAKGADMEMRPDTVIIFGNPQMGTPLMRSSPSIGVDLPLKVAAYEDDDGKVYVIYRDFEELAKDHGVDDAEAVGKVAKTLEELTNKAIGEN